MPVKGATVMNEDEKRLDGQFTREVYRDIHSVHAKHGLAPRTRMLHLIDRYKSASEALRNMPSGEMSSGLLDLAQASLLHLSVEYRMLKPEYERLFDKKERREAYEALKAASAIVSGDNSDRPIWEPRIDHVRFILE